LCKYRVQIVGREGEQGAPQQGHHFHVRAGHALPAEPTVIKPAKGYEMHPIEAESFELIERGLDWSSYPESDRGMLQRLVHTSGEFEIVKDVFVSQGAMKTGMRGLRERAGIVTDVTMVQSGLRRALLEQLGLKTFCYVHDAETYLLAEANEMTRSAAGIRRAWQMHGNRCILAIGDAPTAVEEAIRLIQEQGWRPYLIVGLPVGFVGTEACKEKLRRCLSVARITNRGTRGGSPWAAAVINALLIQTAIQLTLNENGTKR
jgi:precorrin-8X/cobalt-precorrin-8 methylmutase